MAEWLDHYPACSRVDATKADEQIHAVMESMACIAPRDELEGMMTAQLLADHNAANNPMQSTSSALLSMHQSPRCGAKTRSGSPCRSPAMPNGRCRMHGGHSTGAPIGNRNALKHGRYTAGVIAERREITAQARAMWELVEQIE